MTLRRAVLVRSSDLGDQSAQMFTQAANLPGAPYVTAVLSGDVLTLVIGSTVAAAEAQARRALETLGRVEEGRQGSPSAVRARGSRGRILLVHGLEYVHLDDKAADDLVTLAPREVAPSIERSLSSRAGPAITTLARWLSDETIAWTLVPADLRRLLGAPHDP